MMQFASLGSGSRGNATLVRAGSTTVLVDCGFSLRETEARLARLEVDAAELDAILVTHEHGDHSNGVARLSRKYQIPVFMTRGTWASGRCEGVASLVYVQSDTHFDIGAITVSPIAVPHDAREPCQYLLRTATASLGILTDIGSITPAVTSHYRGCRALLLECNHDTDLLHAGPYPASVKQRVAGDWGHLNNRQAAQLLAAVQTEALEHLVIAHISEKNNCREQVRDALADVFERIDEVVWADQSTGFHWISLD